MKVVITLPLGERLGGAENMLWTFLRHVDRTRIEPVVVFLQTGPFEREVASLGIRTITLPVGRLRQVQKACWAIVSLRRLLRSERPDLILNWMGKSQLYGAAAAALAGMSDRVVWWQHGVPDGHWLDRLATLLPTRAVGCSSLASARAQERLRPRRRTFVVHPGIDPPVVSQEEASALRRQLAIPEDTTVFGIVGRLQPWKGQHRFVHALAKLRSRGHDIQGLVVGGTAYGLSPGYEEQVQKLARELGIERFVFFTGQVDDALPYVAVMDALVNASAPEPFGLVLVEAMALGVPVVAVDLGGPAEIVDPDRSGVLVSQNTPALLADALERLIQDPELRRRLGEGARERYRDRFTGTRMAESLQSELEELVQ